MSRRTLILAVPVLATLLTALGVWPSLAQEPAAKKRKVQKTDAEWAKKLTRTQFEVTRRKATEPAFTGKYATGHFKGTFDCVCCGAELFSSKAKFDSGTGWPSFWQPIKAKNIDTAADYHMAEPRVEVMCNDCGAHLGHVFNDGPEPTGLRYCINSASIKLVPFADAATSKKTAAKAKGKSAAKGKEKEAAPDEAKGEAETATKSENPAEAPKADTPAPAEKPEPK